jgi:hypothetical protein
MTYDSTQDTHDHIARVRDLIQWCSINMARRAACHDASKLESPEKEIFDRVTPALRGLTYGSDEYKAQLAEMKPALDHHYANNPHHPEYHGEQGISGMSLLDLLEMICDWKAATERHADGDLGRSIEINRKRFGISDQLACVLANTKKELGW